MDLHKLPSEVLIMPSKKGLEKIPSAGFIKSILCSSKGCIQDNSDIGISLVEFKKLFRSDTMRTVRAHAHYHRNGFNWGVHFGVLFIIAFVFISPKKGNFYH